MTFARVAGAVFRDKTAGPLPPPEQRFLFAAADFAS
jgi:hypothetical protein